ncbi:RND family transporter [candidate division CSSED10-310 bacterium]|uniref:RND family transporter n=1 Tax=candidate division CSSED10-310 bacterium TaxID=2855610 RepID=A0ABV6YR02_UNCC1
MVIPHILQKYCRFLTHHARGIAICIAIFTVGCLVVSIRLTVNNNLLDLLPRNLERVQKFLNVITDFGPEENVILILRPDKNGSISDCIDFAQEVEDRLRDEPAIAEVNYQTKLLTENTITFCLNNLFLLASPEVQQKILESLTEQRIEENLTRFRSYLLTSSIPSQELQYLKMDPLGLSAFIINDLLPESLKENFDLHSGYYISKTASFMLMFLKPAHPPSNMDYNQHLLSKIDTALEEARQEIPGVSSEITGIYAVMTESFYGLRSDMLITVLVSCGGVLFLYGVVYRRLFLLMAMLFSLGIGMIWTIGTITLFFKQLNVITSIFPAILLGLGADFAIHLLERYFSEVESGHNHEQALELALAGTGHGIIIACLTTSFAFLSLLLTDYPAFKQLGIMASAGLIFLLIAVFTVTPLLLIFRYSDKKVGLTQHPPSTLFLSYLLKIQQRPRLIVVMFLLVSIFFLGLVLDLEFQDDYLALAQSKDNKALKLQDQLEKEMGRSIDHSFLLFEGTDLESLLIAGEDFSYRLQQLPENERPVEIENVSSWLPSLKRQTERRSSIQALCASKGSPAAYYDAISAIILQKTKKLGLSESYIRTQYLPRIKPAFALNQISFSTYPHLLRIMFVDPFVRLKENSTLVINRLYYQRGLIFKKGSSHDSALPRDVLLPGQGEFFNIALIMSDMRSQIVKDIVYCVLLSVVTILLLLLVDFRHCRYVLLVLSPVLFGIVWMLGWLHLGGGSLNAISIGIIPLVIGIGIDDGIHLMQRFRESGNKFRPHQLTSCLRAIILTSLTTMIGFGSLMLVNTPGIISLGALAVLGVGCCLVISLVFLPAVLVLLSQNEGG